MSSRKSRDRYKKRSQRALLLAEALVVLTILLALACPERVSAQWAKIACVHRTPGIFPIGAITYCDGLVWVGDSIVSVSRDSGLSWTTTAFPAVRSNYADMISCISFFDRLNGVVVTFGNSSSAGVFRTKD